MSYIQREMDRVSAALTEAPRPADYAELYAAQQALAWALDPYAVKAPLTMIRGIQAETEDCPGCPCPGPS